MQTQPQGQMPKLIPVTDWEKFHAWPKVAGLRHLILNSKTNGFGVCMRRVGRRILIDEAAFFRWVESQKDKRSSDTQPTDVRAA